MIPISANKQFCDSSQQTAITFKIKNRTMTHKEQKDWTENVRWADDRQALLDDFAKAAMQASMSNEYLRKALILDARQAGVSVDEYIARDAYDIAYALMQERERRMKG